MPASRTTKTLRPAELTQILPTGLLVGETRLELGQILADNLPFPKILHLVNSPESSEYPELTSDAMHSLLVDVTGLVPFKLERVHRARRRELFRGPLLLVHQSPPAQGGRIRVAVAESDVIFNETYYGYSAKKHSNGKRLVRYLALLVGSKLADGYSLDSGK